MGNREFEGRDLEEAIREAAAALGVPAGELHYEIVEQGRKGVFGLGAKNVRILVMPPVDELTDEQLRSLPVPRSARTEAVGAPNRQGATTTAKPGPSPRSNAVGQVAAVVESNDAERAARREPSPEQHEVERTLTRIVELTGLDLNVDSTSAAGEVTLSVDGPDRKLLTHKNGELLHALQFLLNRMARRAWPGVRRVMVSAAGEREDRDNQLVHRAREIAQQVTETGKPRRTRPMNAYERRLVHLTVREIGGLASRSEGDGSLKRVRILKDGSQ